MLRHVLGDPVFFDALRAFGTAHAYGTATTEDFRDVCEAVSGRDLDRYFQQWIYGEYYPAYSYTWTAEPSAGGWDVSLTLDQTQPGQLFWMPVDVTITTALGETTLVVWDSLATQQFTLTVPAQPTAIALDKDNWILRTVQAPIVSAAFDRSVLLVNGVEWATYGSEITNPYLARAFWGDYAIDFWDYFDAPAGGYPATLPAPLGHGVVPPEVMGRYRNVIWVGNNLGGDLAGWLNSPVLSYLSKGGNLLLMSRMGDQFLPDTLRRYLGITLATGTVLNDCVATRPGLTNMGLTGTQNLCVVFDTTRSQPDAQLLYKVASGYSPQRGIGFYREPAGGGTQRPQGGRFIFLSGRPYRWNSTQLRNNVMTMLSEYFLEPIDLAGVGGPPPPAHVSFAPPWPSPSAGPTTLRFTLPRPGPVRLEVLDLAGRRVRTLARGPLAAGPHERVWDGSGDDGRAVPAGIYWVRLSAPDAEVTHKTVRLR
jgi:hypothetical protein